MLFTTASIGLLLLTLFSHKGDTYFITVDVLTEECFFDKVKTGTKMGLMFEVAEGGFLDIDVRIEGKTIFNHPFGRFAIRD